MALDEQNGVVVSWSGGDCEEPSSAVTGDPSDAVEESSAHLAVVGERRRRARSVRIGIGHNRHGRHGRRDFKLVHFELFRLLNHFELVGGVKQLKRVGWIQRMCFRYIDDRQLQLAVK